MRPRKKLASHFDVESLDFVGSGEDTSTGNTTKDIGTVTLEEGGETLMLENLSTAIKGRFVVNT